MLNPTFQHLNNVLYNQWCMTSTLYTPMEKAIVLCNRWVQVTRIISLVQNDKCHRHFVFVFFLPSLALCKTADYYFQATFGIVYHMLSLRYTW